jgi:hypothetical protein
MKCAYCGKVMEHGKGDTLTECGECRESMKKDQDTIEALVKEGHTRHCACRKVWGDGECECDMQPRDISALIAALTGGGA